MAKKPRNNKARARKVHILFTRFGRDKALDMLNGKVFRDREKAYHEKCPGASGYVYIADIGDGLYKIGKTSDLAKRQLSLSAANPKFRIVFNRYVKDMGFVEKETHQKLAKCHVQRELFRLPEFELDQAKRCIENFSGF